MLNLGNILISGAVTNLFMYILPDMLLLYLTAPIFTPKMFLHDTHTYIHTYMHLCMHAYIHTCIHTYIHIYMHTHTHVHTHIMHACMHTSVTIKLSREKIFIPAKFIACNSTK